MKEVVTILMLIGCCSIATAFQCCQNNEIIKAGGYCDNSTRRININCTLGHMLLKNIIVTHEKLSTEDTPGYVFAEDPKQYCIGKMFLNESDHDQGLMAVAVVCFEEITKKGDDDIQATGVLTLLSSLFLVFTLAVYMFVKELRDLQGLCYMCMCVSLASGFLCLGILQLNRGFHIELCTLTGFLVYFWMIATFFWMNVICINVLRTIIDSSYLKRTERVQFFWYSCYAWGGTILFLTVALITNFVEGNHWKPGFGKNSCWFQGRTETWIFFYGPISVLIAANIGCFILSSYNLWQHRGNYEVNRLNNLKHKFLLSLKLFLVMGLSWIFEIASFAHGEAHIIWTIMDIFNCLQGVVMFILLVVLRRRAIQGLAEAGCCLSATRLLASKLSPHDNSDNEHMIPDENMEVRLN